MYELASSSWISLQDRSQIGAGGTGPFQAIPRHFRQAANSTGHEPKRPITGLFSSAGLQMKCLSSVKLSLLKTEHRGGKQPKVGRVQKLE